MTADTIVLGAHDVQNTGRIDGRKVNIKASQNVINTGNIHGDKQVTINAGRDINVGAHVDRLEHHDIVSRQGTIGVGKDGDLVLSAKRDVNLKGAIVHTGDNSKATIEAGHNINLTTEALSSKKDMTVNSDNYNRTDRRTELGTAVLTDSHVNLHAGNDVNIRNGIVNSEHGVTSVEAGNDVNITNGKSYSRDEYGLKYKEKSLLSRKTNIIRTDHEHTGVLSSTIGGDTINVKANRNVSVTGSNILGTKDVSVSAGNDVRTDSGEETQRDDVYQYSKKSGLMGAGIGFTIGSKKVTDTTDGRYKTQVASNIASSDGKIKVKAGNEIHSTTTNYFSNQPADLSAQNVIVDGKHNTAHVVQSHEEKRSGLTVSVGGQIINELNNVQQLGKRANSRKNSKLSTLEYLEAANTLKHAYNDGATYNNAKIEKLVEKEKAILAKADELNTAYQAEHPEEKNAMHPDVKAAINNVNNRAKKDSLLNIHVGVGSSKFKQVSELNQENYVGSSIGSKNKVNITADSDNSAKGNIHITGSVIEAPEVNLNATNNLSLDAGRNASVQRDTYTSSGWSVGATVSPHGNGVIGLEANVYKGKENALETTKTHTGTIIRGKQVNTVSGNDTEIIGSKVIGDSVTTKVGHDLKIESLQDTNDYHKISKNKGISVSYGMSGSARVGFDNSRGSTDSHYASVTEQAGIYAGDGGYNVQVNNATTLTGGIIKGSTDKSKNKLSSNSLTMNDIHNEASYSAKTSGYSLSTTKRSKNNPIGITGSPKMGIPVKGNSKSTTHSAISEGIIEIAEKESLEKINHDTEQALNKLAPIFDKKTVEEKQILLTKISNHGYKLIGDISTHQQTQLLNQIIDAKRKNDKAKAESLLKEYNKWGENGVYRLLLHSGFGAFIAKTSGNGGFNGFNASSANILLNNTKNKDLGKIFSLVIGKAVGNDAGAAVSSIARENNWLEHKDRQNLNNDFAILIANVDNLSEPEKLHQLRKKAAYYYALMRYQRDYHEYYNGDNEVHPTDGGIHLGQPYYTTESYEKLVNNLFAYMMGDNQSNIDYYTALSDDYYYDFVNNNKYIQDKGYDVSIYNAGWQEDDGQYYNKLINGGTVLNGRFRGKQLELEGYPTVLGDDGQTYYTLDENGRPWYNPNPSNQVKIQLSKEKQQKLVTQRLHKINENSKTESNNESYTVQDGEKALESLYNQIPKIRKRYNGAAEATEIFLYAGDKSDLIGKYGIVDVKGSTNDIQTVVIDKDSVLGQTMVPSERMKLDAIVAFMTILKEKGINIDNTGQSTINSHPGVQSINQYLTVGTYLISPRVFYDEYNDVYYGTMIVADRWDNGGKLAKLGIISAGEYNNPIHNAYVIQVTNLRKPYNNEVHDIPFSVSGKSVRERL